MGEAKAVDRAALRAAAEAATPGPWYFEPGAGVYALSGGLVDKWIAGVPSAGAVAAGEVNEADAQYHTAADPQTVLALLDALDAAEERERKLVVLLSEVTRLDSVQLGKGMRDRIARNLVPSLRALAIANAEEQIA